MLEARVGLDSAHYLHWRLANQAAAMRGSVQRQGRCLKLGHDAPHL
jgi:hypothetical protein